MTKGNSEAITILVCSLLFLLHNPQVQQVVSLRAYPVPGVIQSMVNNNTY